MADASAATTATTSPTRCCGASSFNGELPDLETPFAPTPHPLSNLLGALVAPLGRPAGAEAFRLVIAVSLGAMAVAAYDVGRQLFNAPAGLLAALVLVTRPALVAGALRGSIDIPALALTLFALSALLRRRYTLTLILLAVAGLLRPEAWLLSVAVAAWWLWSERPAHRARIVALALAAPVLWCATDLLITGDPLLLADRHARAGRGAQPPAHRAAGAAARPAADHGRDRAAGDAGRGLRAGRAVRAPDAALQGRARRARARAGDVRGDRRRRPAAAGPLPAARRGAAGDPRRGCGHDRTRTLLGAAAAACLLAAIPGTVTGLADAVEDSRARGARCRPTCAR